MKLFDRLYEKWTDFRTKTTKEQRDWKAWYEVNVVYRASTIENMFMHFEHVIIVNPDKFFQFDPFAWVPSDDANQYFYPARPLGQNCVWRFERVRLDQWDHQWHVDPFGGDDKVFVATNSDTDAAMIALKYA